MWDNLYAILFNTNHEMPIGVLVGIPIAVVLFNQIVTAYGQRRAYRKNMERVTRKNGKTK